MPTCPTFRQQLRLSPVPGSTEEMWTSHRGLCARDGLCTHGSAVCLSTRHSNHHERAGLKRGGAAWWARAGVEVWRRWPPWSRVPAPSLSSPVSGNLWQHLPAPPCCSGLRWDWSQATCAGGPGTFSPVSRAARLCHGQPLAETVCLLIQINVAYFTGVLGGCGLVCMYTAPQH